jgi:hypothetical protein
VLLFVLALSGLISTPSDAATKKKTSDGQVCTIVGTAKSDVIKGTKKRDVICGLGGNDKISGLGGDDVIDGGVGKDKIDGGPGDDKILGGAGTDLLSGGVGNDTLQGGAGKDLFDGGTGVNSCDLQDNLGEVRDYTCSLLPNLAYMLKRVSGRVTSPGLNFDGCAMALHPEASSAVVQGEVYDGGKFDFAAPPGDYSWFLRAPDGVDSKACRVQGAIQVIAYHLVVDSNTPFVNFIVPSAVTFRIYVRNTMGAPLMGATVSVQSNSPWDSCPMPMEPIGLCGRVAYFALNNPVTNSQGFVEVTLPRGTPISAYATVRFAGITMNTPWGTQTADSGQTVLDLVVQ